MKEIEQIHKEIKKTIPKEHKEFILQASEFLFRKPLIKVLTIIGVLLVLIVISRSLPETGSNLSFFIFLTFFLLGVYIVLLIMNMVKHSFNSLFNAKNMFVLFSSYALFIFCILILASIAFNMSETLGKGYLTYGRCSDTFDKSMITEDTQISRDYFYFSSITFFTVGYGDICPMGWNKILATMLAFIGHFVAVVIMVMVIHYYLKRKEKF